MDFSYGYCHCGCGQKTRLNTMTRNARGLNKGEPSLFIFGHNLKKMRGSDHPRWKGGQRVNLGRSFILKVSHPRSNHGRYVLRSILIAEKALGKPILRKHPVHHINEDQGNDENSNLVLCESQGYHFLIHQRIKALAACGHPQWKKCNICKQYDDPKNLYISANGRNIRHRQCNNNYQKARYHRMKDG